MFRIELGEAVTASEVDRLCRTHGKFSSSTVLLVDRNAPKVGDNVASLASTLLGARLKVLVTGAAGFIGMHVSQILLARGDQVVGLDNLNDYYTPQLKHDRLARLTPNPAFSFVKLDVADRDGIAKLFAEQRFDRVVHLAAQAGVRYSIENPHAAVACSTSRMRQAPASTVATH